MLEERPQQGLLRSRPPERPFNSIGQVVNVLVNVIGQVAVLGSIPDLFVGVEVRGIGRQPFDANAFWKTLQQSPSGRTMNHPTVPHQDDAFRQVNQQLSHKRFGSVSIDVLVGQSEVQSQATTLWRDRNGRDGGEPIPSMLLLA